MKKIILSIIITIFFVGCGGGGAGDEKSSVTIPGDSYGPTSYTATDYIIPSLSTNSINSRTIHNTNYNATYRALNNNTIIETPPNSNGESVKYEKTSKYIKVTLRDKYGKDLYSYNLKQTVRIGESITSPESSCIFVNSFSTKYINNTKYNDVIEIDCGKHKAYYAKKEGLVYKE